MEMHGRMTVMDSLRGGKKQDFYLILKFQIPLLMAHEGVLRNVS